MRPGIFSLLLAALLLVSGASGVPAQTPEQMIPGFLTASGCPSPNLTPCFFASTPTAPISEQLNIDASSVKSLVIPANSTPSYAIIQAQGGTIYYTTVATDTPAVGVGFQMGSGATIPVYGILAMQALKFIGGAGTTISYAFFNSR